MSSSNLHPSAQPAGSLPVAMASNAANLPVVTASDAANLPVVTASNAATLPPAMVSNAANLPVVTAPNAANLSVVTASNATNQNLTNAAQGPVANNMTLPPNNNGGGGVTFASNFVLPHVPNPQQLLAQANLMAQIGLLQTSQPAQTPNRFMFLNQGLFPPFNVHLQQQGQNNGIITLRVQGVNMYVDRMIIDQSEMLRAAFKSNLSEGLTGVMDLEGDLRVWFVVFLAMYGATSIPPSLIRNKPAVVIIEAMVQADYILANLEVKTNICKLLSAHLETFHTWQTIPLIQLTINDHENKAIELNDAWNAYRTLPDVILKPFDEFGFGLLISVCCAGQVYDRVEYLLDDGLVRLVARATKRRLNAMSFSADVRSLFNHN